VVMLDHVKREVRGQNMLFVSLVRFSRVVFYIESLYI
jgi:hypothetical protein